MTRRFDDSHTLQQVSHGYAWPVLIGSADASTSAMHAHREALDELPLEFTQQTEPAAWPPANQQVFVPQGYEPGYAYPVVVWLQCADDGVSLVHLMEQLSERNYFGLALKTASDSASCDEEINNDAPLDLAAATAPPWEHGLTEVYEAVRDLKQRYNIHSERIYLAGLGAAGQQAMEMLLRRPNWFAGALGLDAPMDRLPCRLTSLDAMRGKRLFATQDSAALRVLHTAGAEIIVEEADVAKGMTDPLARRIDLWLMQGICEGTLVT